MVLSSLTLICLRVCRKCATLQFSTAALLHLPLEGEVVDYNVYAVHAIYTVYSDERPNLVLRIILMNTNHHRVLL